MASSLCAVRVPRKARDPAVPVHGVARARGARPPHAPPHVHAARHTHTHTQRARHLHHPHLPPLTGNLPFFFKLKKRHYFVIFVTTVSNMAHHFALTHSFQLLVDEMNYDILRTKFDEF